MDRLLQGEGEREGVEEEEEEEYDVIRRRGRPFMEEEEEEGGREGGREGVMDRDVRHAMGLGKEVSDLVAIAETVSLLEVGMEKEAFLEEFIIQLEAMKERGVVAMEVMRERMRRECRVLLRCQAGILRRGREGGREGLTLMEAWRRLKSL